MLHECLPRQCVAAAAADTRRTPAPAPAPASRAHVRAQVPRGINPTDEEINEHAEYLGIDTVNERELLWIAERCMVAPLPRGWCGLPPLPRTSPLPPRRLAMRASLCALHPV